MKLRGSCTAESPSVKGRVPSAAIGSTLGIGSPRRHVRQVNFNLVLLKSVSTSHSSDSSVWLGELGVMAVIVTLDSRFCLDLSLISGLLTHASSECRSKNRDL